MTLANNGDVSINGVTYFLKEQPDGSHYMHSYEHLQVSFWVSRPIAGLPGKEDIRRDLMYWDSSDFSGGEGEKFFDSNDPSMYYTSSDANTRNPGYVTTRPARTITTVS